LIQSFQGKAVGYLHDQAGGGRDNGGVGLTAVTCDNLDLWVRFEPVFFTNFS